MTLTTKPDYGSTVLDGNVLTPPYQNFLDEIEIQVNALQKELNVRILGPVVQLSIYTVGTLPDVVEGGMIYVSDEVGGPVMAFSDGVNWLRCTDRAIVS